MFLRSTCSVINMNVPISRLLRPHVTSYRLVTSQSKFCSGVPLTKTILTAELDGDIDEAMTEGLHPRQHPGRRNMGQVTMPVFLELAAKRVIHNNLTTRFRADVSRARARVDESKLPDEPHEIREKERMALEKVLAQETVDVEMLTESEKEYFLEKRRKKVQRIVNETTVTWKDIQYDDYSSVVYLAARLAPNYASMLTVFNEIKKSDPTFSPKTILDFGSGVGATMYAANETWPASINEHFNCDSCKSMNDVSRLLLQGGDERQPLLYPGVFYRQFLPASVSIKYDMVVSSFTLMELPNQRSRVQVVENLWNKTQDLLVLVEHGSSAGFRTILEARNLILTLNGYDVTKSYYNDPNDVSIVNYDPENAPTAHIMAPCTHHFSCPRNHLGGPVMCNLEVPFTPLDINVREKVKKEVFSYIVLRKGPEKVTDQSHWPRVVQPVKKGSGHTICRLCCPDGTIRSVTFTNGKHHGNVYNCAKISRWGDRLPMTIIERETFRSSRELFNKRRKMEQKEEAEQDQEASI